MSRDHRTGAAAEVSVADSMYGSPKEPLCQHAILVRELGPITIFRLPDDVWEIIVQHMVLHDCMALVNLRNTCAIGRQVMNQRGIDAAIGASYARYVLDDDKFWKFARTRPKWTSQPLRTYLDEVCRIESFRRRLGVGRLAACELYRLWPLLDAPYTPRTLTMACLPHIRSERGNANRDSEADTCAVLHHTSSSRSLR